MDSEPSTRPASSAELAFAVVVAGLPGTLKTTLATRLGARLEAPVVAMSDHIEPIVEDGHVLHPVIAAERLNRIFGADHLMEAALRSEPQARVLIVDGPRHPAQLGLLRRRCRRVVLIEVSSPTATRHQRIRDSPRDLPDIDPQELDDRNRAAGLPELLKHAELTVELASHDDLEADTAELRVWRHVREAFRDSVVSWLRDRGYAKALDLLREPSGVYIVGGAIRDHLLGATAPIDLDIVADDALLPGVQLRLGTALEYERTRHASRRYLIGPRRWVDAFAPGSFEAGYDSVPQMLSNFDLSIHGIGIGLADGDVVNPIHGLRDLNLGVMSLTEQRWADADDHEAVLLCLRVVRLAAEFGLRVTNPGVLAHRCDRLGAISDEEIERRLGSAVEVRDGLAQLAATGRLQQKLSIHSRRPD